MPLPPIAAPVVCEVSLAEYEDILDEAAAKLETDSEAFRMAAGQVMEKLPCLRDTLVPEQAAKLHFVLGLLMVEERDEAGARRAFCSAFTISPGLPVPEAIKVQSDFARHRVSVAAGEDCAKTAVGGRPVVAPPGTEVIIDGREPLDRPVDRPYLVQVVWARDGEVHFTGYLSMETYELDLQPFAPPPPPPPVVRLVPRWHPAAALGATVGAGVLYSLAWNAQIRYVDEETSDDDRYGYQAANQALSWSALGVAGVAAGLDLWLIARNLRAPGYEEPR